MRRTRARDRAPGGRVACATLGLERLEERVLLSEAGLSALAVPDEPVSEQDEARALELFQSSSANFVENVGQWDDSVRFMHAGQGANVWFTDHGPVLQLFDATGQADAWGVAETYVAVTFDGAAPSTPVGLDAQPGVANYYAADSDAYVVGAASYRTVLYADLYEGVDLAVWGQNTSLKYEFTVAPGADWQQIQVRYENADGLWVDADGALHVQTALGELVDEAPFVYQEIAGRRVEVEAAFEVVDGNSYRFVLLGDYDPTVELVLDPDLQWTTSLGGPNKELGARVVLDSQGNVYVMGYTYPYSGSETVDGSFGARVDPEHLTSEEGNDFEALDAFVTKLSPTGERLWSTYFFGTSVEVGLGVVPGGGIAVDDAGCVYVTGRVVDAFWVSGGFDTTANGEGDAFVAKLGPSGVRVWSTYLGGELDDHGTAIALGRGGYVYVTGETMSPGWAVGGYDTSHNGLLDAFVAKLDSQGDLVWSTYLGGMLLETSTSIVVDGSAVYVTGATQSQRWVSGGADRTHGGYFDGFVVRLNSADGGHVWSTFFGGSDWDSGYDLDVDAVGAVYVAGDSASPGWVSGGFNTVQAGQDDAVVLKFAPNGRMLWSTYLGGSAMEVGIGIAVSATGSVHVTGLSDSPTWNAGGFDNAYNGGFDAFVVTLSGTGGHEWSTYLGGEGQDIGHGVAVDGEGAVYVAVDTSGFGANADVNVLVVKMSSEPADSSGLAQWLVAADGQGWTGESLVRMLNSLFGNGSLVGGLAGGAGRSGSVLEWLEALGTGGEAPAELSSVVGRDLLPGVPLDPNLDVRTIDAIFGGDITPAVLTLW